ncbi:hypothetical protein IT414_02590 [bacterium]|nr:hypothetical protein [bacterium]
MASVLAIFTLAFFYPSLRALPVSAADNNFADGITVDSTGDGADANIADSICDDGSGNCTLRAAIEEANDTPGTQTIRFNITGLADFTNAGQNGYAIRPISALPVITDSTIIDGYTQAGATPNATVSPQPFDAILLVELDGQNAGGNGILGDPSNVAGLQFGPGSQNSLVRGLVINEFTGAGLSVGIGADNIEIYGNYIGTDYLGLVAEPNNGQGITVFGPTSTTGGPVNGRIGGSAAEERNIISGNDSGSNDPNRVIGVQGISMTSSSAGWTIQGNYIGLGSDGVSNLGNELGGMTIDYVQDLLVGGGGQGEGTVVSGNGDGGIQPDGSDNIVIQGNYIGTDYTGTSPLPNYSKGISFLGTTNSLVGGDNSGEGNIIANAGNTSPGIFLNDGNGVAGPLGDSQDIAILGNSIYDNSDIGIDLGFDGVTSNDTNDSDVGSNNSMNFPVYTRVAESGGDTVVDYRLDVPAGDYRIEFFSNLIADPSGYGEGEIFLGYQNISHPGGGNVNFSHTLIATTGITNLAMTTTQRNVATASGFGATSEFSSNGTSQPVADFGVEKVLLNPQDVAIGATIGYRVTVRNVVGDPIDLAAFDGGVFGSTNLLTDIMSPDITYAGGVSDANIDCQSAGPGSASIFGPAMANHSEFEILLCSWVGASHVLSPGESFSFTYNVTVQPNSDLIFDNYAIIPPTPSDDPDTAALGAIYLSGSDIIDSLLTNGTINNFAASHYPIVVQSTELNGVTLPSTGENDSLYRLLAYSAVGLGMLLLAIFCLDKHKRHR